MRILSIILGSLSLFLGVLGIFLPLLPTTPFVLLAAALYFRSSPKLYEWLINTEHLGVYIRNYRENRSIPLRAKISSVVLLWITMLYCIHSVVVGRLWLQILLYVIAIGVSIHILRLRTSKRQNKD